MTRDQQPCGTPLLRWVSFQEAAAYSPWPGRLTGAENWRRQPRDESEVLREFNDGWFRRSLELWEAFSASLKPADIHPGAVLRFLYQIVTAASRELERHAAIYKCAPGSKLFSIGDQLLVGDLTLGSMLHVDMIVRYVEKLLEEYPVQIIVEPGCGIGVNLFHLHSRLNIKRIVGGDLSPNAVTLGNRVSKRLGIHGTFRAFDYKDKASARILTDGLENYLLLTCHSIEQTPIGLTESIISDILDLPNRPSVVIHFEPMSSGGPDTFMGELCKKYAEMNHYNCSLLQVVSRYEQDKRLEILDYQSRYFGINAFHPLSMLCWRAL